VMTGSLSAEDMTERLLDRRGCVACGGRDEGVVP